MRLITAVFVIVFLTEINCNAEKLDEKVNNKDWWEKTIYYQIYPRSFKDSNGDGIGDLRGITNKLVHLKNAGIGATWLSPIFKSPMVDFGYDIQDFKQIDASFGDLFDLEAMIAEARRLGIKIILDLVPNHTSNQCEWFIMSENKTSGYEDYYIWRDGLPNGSERPKLPNNWISVFSGSVWTWSEKRQQYYMHQFTKEQPDLNFRNSKVQTEMIDVIMFWLKKGVDGFRIDAINHMFEDELLRDDPLIEAGLDPTDYNNLNHIYTKDLPESYQMVYSWRKLLKTWQQENGGDTRVLMTEAYGTPQQTIDWYGSDTDLGSHIPFNFLLIMDLNKDSKVSDFKNKIDHWLSLIPKGQNANWVLGNHDRARVGSRYPGMVDAMNTLLLTLPGIPVTYYGEEIGMLDNRNITWKDTQDPQACLTNDTVFQNFTRDPIRTPFQWDSTENAGFSSAPKTWLPLNDNFKTNNLDAQMTEPNSFFKVYNNLAKLRQEDTFIYGDYKSFASDDQKIFIHIRTLVDHKTYVTVINFEEKNKSIALRNVFTGLPESGVIVSVGSSKLTAFKLGETIEIASLELSEYEAIVISFKNSSHMMGCSFTLIIVAFLNHFIFKLCE